MRFHEIFDEILCLAGICLHRGGSNTNNSNANDFAGHLSFSQSSNILQAYLF